jgi:hypothetical protein
MSYLHGETPRRALIGFDVVTFTGVSATSLFYWDGIGSPDFAASPRTQDLRRDREFLPQFDGSSAAAGFTRTADGSGSESPDSSTTT